MIPAEFLLFGAVLIGVAVSHRHAMAIAMSGATGIALYKILLSSFPTGTGLSGFVGHLGHDHGPTSGTGSISRSSSRYSRL